MKLALQELCTGIVSGLLFTQEREGGSPGLDGVGRAEEAAGKRLSLKLRAVRAELAVGFPACSKGFFSLCFPDLLFPVAIGGCLTKTRFWEIFPSLKENQLKITHKFLVPMQNKVIVTSCIRVLALC